MKIESHVPNALTEFEIAVQRAQEWARANNASILALTRQMDGRWFATVNLVGEKTWCAERNMFIERRADLGHIEMEG
jgi:hypothetical protein